MLKKPINEFKDKDQAREFAIDWQNWVGDQALSLQELVDWQDYLEEIGKRYGLLAEFKENTIV